MFITFLPVDKWGNTPYGCLVIEVKEETTRIADMEFEDFRVVAPQSFLEKWPTISPHPYPWLEVTGPARSLTEHEWIALIEQAVGQEKCHADYLKYARARIGG